MPRQARLDAPGTVHHIMVQGIDKEFISGGQRRRGSEGRANIACYLSREMGISMAEMARRLEVGTSAIAMAIRRKNSKGRKL